jgi:two-component system, OmpR family, osmolarity sensor histidine kinase EnvZ
VIGLKRFLPRTLFGRWLFLLVAPVVLLQIVVTLVFYQRHWDTVTRRLALGVAGEIALLIDTRAYFSDPGDRQRLQRLIGHNANLNIAFVPGATLPGDWPPPRFYSILDLMLTQALSERLSHPFQIDTRRGDEQIEIVVELSDGLLRVLASEKRLFSTTTYIFLMWMVGTSVLLLAVAVLFLRNQIRPIQRLAQAAEAFGKGQEVEDFRPAGATEVRQAAAAFLAMRERILRQISQRTEMLAGVSHDLRTPLTRMKLQLALLGLRPEVADLKRDVAEMEKMIAGYLAFARGQESEATVATDLPELLADVISTMRRHGGNIRLAAASNITVPIRPNAFRRCLVNLIENALRHGRRVEVSAARRGQMVEIAIDDDGPGIPAGRREEVFRPFVRLDESRNPATGGVGLGLTIARDVIRGHGGDIELSTAPIGGLRALLRLPV